MRHTIQGNEYRTTVICVDSCENGALTGRLYNPYLEGGKAFRSLMQLLVTIEDLLDEMQLPQSFTALRAFSAPPAKRKSAQKASEAKAGDCGTFSVQIIFRQNASWQGTVNWLEGKREESFRSALELILLIGSALECDDSMERGGSSPSKSYSA